MYALRVFEHISVCPRVLVPGNHITVCSGVLSLGKHPKSAHM